MTYHRVCNKIITTGATGGAGTAYPSGTLEFTPGFQWDSCYSIFSFICMFSRSMFVLFLFAIVLSVLLRFTNSDYPFGIFKLFLINYIIQELYFAVVKGKIIDISIKTPKVRYQVENMYNFKVRFHITTSVYSLWKYCQQCFIL